MERYLTAVVDIKTRVILHYVVTPKRPDGMDLRRLLFSAALVSGVPRKVITDCYLAYRPAMNALSSAMSRSGRGRVVHVTVRSKDKSKLRYSSGGTAVHNNHVESLWSKIKRNMGNVTGYASNFDTMIAYSVINYNFLRPHGDVGTFLADRHGIFAHMDKTPAMAAGYDKWHATFGEMLEEAWNYEKSFLFRIKPESIKRVRISVRKDGVTVSAKPNTTKGTLGSLDRDLVRCGFASNPRKNEWTKRMDSFGLMHDKKKASLPALEMVPIKTVEVCNRCGVVAFSMPQVHEVFGYRRTGGMLLTQPNCHRCRSAKGADPTSPTGPNKKRMGRIRR